MQREAESDEPISEVTMAHVETWRREVKQLLGMLLKSKAVLPMMYRMLADLLALRSARPLGVR